MCWRKLLKDKFIITIDGPAGAGKTTIAKMVAEKIGFKYIDTGSMYRAVTLKIIESGLHFSSVPLIEQLAESTDINIEFDESSMKILLDGKNVTNDIRKRTVTDNTSIVAAIPGVRYKLARIQRRTAEKFKKVVYDGRDMGSIVFPQADLKVYLDASISVRARRRWLELKGKGEVLDIKVLEAQISKRDKLDESRGLAPLVVPEGAHVIDSTNMSIPEVVDSIIALLHR
jgi:cytidylate kinase